MGGTPAHGKSAIAARPPAGNVLPIGALVMALACRGGSAVGTSWTRGVADANALGDAGTAHVGTGGHVRYVDIAMRPTSVSNVWPPPGTAAHNTWPADVLGEASSHGLSRGILYAAGNPPREIDLSATCNQTGTRCCWEPTAPVISRLGVSSTCAPRRFFVSEGGHTSNGTFIPV